MEADNTKLIDLLCSKKWFEILELKSDPVIGKVQWVWPTIKDLHFISNHLKKYGKDKLISIGCGCGLLERIFQEVTGTPVVGYEVNKTWWQSKYSSPQFIDVIYCDENEDLINNNAIPENYALLFCYFNDGDAFRDYIKNYKGHLVIIIGPSEGSGRHTDPQPFSANFGNAEWHLIDSKQVRDTVDYIAVYSSKS